MVLRWGTMVEFKSLGNDHTVEVWAIGKKVYELKNFWVTDSALVDLPPAQGQPE